MLERQLQEHTWSEQCERVLRQAYGVLCKNASIHLSNKKKLMGQFVMPILISTIYATRQVSKKSPSDDIAQSMILIIVMDLLLKIYIGLIGTTAIKELVTIFIPERTDKFRQYQFIFGLNHQVYTLSNLFYMGVYLSILILPFYLTINYFDFDLVYILYFGSFVISQLTLAMALTAFFKDHKIANQIIGMLFSLSTFLVFFYQNNPQKAHNFSDYFAMIMPNSSFAIAIMYKDTRASLYSLFFVKFYLIIYSIFEYPEFFRQKLCRCCQKITSYLPLQRQQTNLMEQFQLNEVVNSDIQHNSMMSSQNKKIVIKTEGLIKTYSINKTNFNALNGINLKIHKSQIFGLLGRNGAGKTTLVDILTKIIKPTAGTFQIVNNKQTIGICYQHEILYDLMTVEEHLYVYSFIKPINFQSKQARNEHIEDIIRKLNIEDERKKQVKELSGGNKRKLSIAIAILGNPEILIFDQPTSGLDPLSRINVWQILQKLRSTESTIILTTHHLDEAQKLSDWICVIDKGAVIVENTAENIKQNYGKGYHLTISTLDKEGGKFVYQDIQKYKVLIEKYKLKSVELQHLKNQLNYLVKPINKTIPSQQFQNNFIEIVEQLQKNTTVEFKFHSNTLEQSFIAIIKDTDNNSGDSLGENSVIRREKHQFQPYDSLRIAIFKFIGAFIKNFYYQKSNFVQSIILNNINIMILLISIYFNKFMVDVISQKIPESSKQMNATNAKANNSSYALLQGYVIMTIAYIYTPVYEKQNKIRGVLNTRGLPWVGYWLGNFAYDFLVFNVNLLILTKLIAPELVALLGWFTLFKLGIGIILFAYCFSYLFDKVKTASVWFSLINVVLGMITMAVILIGKHNFLKYFTFLRYVYPFYDLTSIVIYQSTKSSTEALAEFIELQKPSTQYIYINILLEVLFLICLETKIFQRTKNAFRRNQSPRQIPQVIKLQNISKSYGQIQALKDVSYYANQERLALLGHNGAGKSTTFGLLSAQLSQDSGQLYVEKTLHESHNTTLRSTGICYQQDSLWQNVLVSEIFKIFSYIIPIRRSKSQIDWLIQSLQYEAANLDKRFSALSGGNKRKLCMMIALYGDPLVRLLDQCSTGLDPSSRLAMVEAIKSSRKGTTVFTTHSMSQAEDLCQKTVIMSKGKVLEFEYINKLKSKYFNCCWINLKILQGQQQQRLKEVVIKQLEMNGVKLVANERGSLRMQVQKRQVRIGKILRILQRLKSRRIVESYSNVEPKLEDVYIKVTREQALEIQSHQNVGQLLNPRGNVLGEQTS